MAHGKAVTNIKRKRHECSIGVENNAFPLAYKRLRKEFQKKERATFLFGDIVSQAVSVVFASANETDEMHKRMQPTVLVPGSKTNRQDEGSKTSEYSYNPTFLTNVVVWVLVTCCVYTRMHDSCERSLLMGWADCIPAILIYFIASVLSPTMNWLIHPANDDGVYKVFDVYKVFWPHVFFSLLWAEHAKNVLVHLLTSWFGAEYSHHHCRLAPRVYTLTIANITRSWMCLFVLCSCDSWYTEVTSSCLSGSFIPSWRCQSRLFAGIVQMHSYGALLWIIAVWDKRVLCLPLCIWT